QAEGSPHPHDGITATVANIRKHDEAGPPLPVPADHPQEPSVPELPIETVDQPSEVKAPAPKAPAKQSAEPPKAARKPAKSRNKAADAQRAAQETIRVSAPLLDELVNLAGETSITRGRL